MKAFLLAAFVVAGYSSSAQYYYQDIIGTREINNRMQALMTANVKTVVATGYDQEGVKTSDFGEVHEVSIPERSLKITTRNNRSLTSVTYQFDAKTRLITARDSSGPVQVVSTYTYDNANLVSIKSVAQDADSVQNFSAAEEHRWIYNSKGQPEKMWRIVNNKDSFEYRFTLDEAGNVTEEKFFRRGAEADFIYYYYNDKNQVTDVVRFNKTLMSLIPDMILEYDDNGHVIQKITPVSFKNPNYLIWRYGFDGKGLKTKEALYNKNKQRTGTIDYQYSFAH